MLHPSSLTSDLPMRRLRALAAQPLARLTQTRQFGFYVSEKRPVLQTSAARQALDVDARAEWQSRVEERNRAIASWRPTTWRGARGRIPPKPKPLTRPGWRPRPGRPLLAVRLLWQHGAAALAPGTTLGGGRRAALVSARTAALLRKKAVLQGTFGEFTPEHSDEHGNGAGWDPAWDPTRAPHIVRPYKGTKRARTREARVASIDRAMEGMPQKIAAYRKERDARKPPPGIEQVRARAAAARERERGTTERDAPNLSRRAHTVRVL